MKFRLVTNNPYVKEQYGDRYPVDYYDCTYEEVLLEVLHMCEEGYQVLTHPLSGSVKPNETPYKTVMVSEKQGRADVESIQLMEKCLVTCRKFPKLHVNWTDQVLADFQMVDYTLISSAI